MRWGRDDALRLARQADTILVARGPKVVRLDLRKEKLNDDTLASYLLGPTGNLRAPVLKLGKTLMVGFNPDVYRELLAK
ncbi:MAG: hypothetical protein C4297_03855 [Gemmataceae bacterium]